MSVPLWGNCRLVLPRLIPLLGNRGGGVPPAPVSTMTKDWNDQRDTEADAAAVPIRPPFIIKVLSEIIPENAVISLDEGENQWWFGRNFRMKRQRFAMSGYLATMGFGLPGAIAAKFAYPDRPVFCITGDGGFSMAMADFVTAIKYNLPIVILILNNQELGMSQVEQMSEHYPNFATDLHNPDFARYAEACGGAGMTVERPEELKSTILKAMSMNLPVIVDVKTDPKRLT